MKGIIEGSFQVYPECITSLQNLRLESFGDAGIFLSTYLFGNEKYVIENPKEVQNAINLWRKVATVYFEIYIIVCR